MRREVLATAGALLAAGAAAALGRLLATTHVSDGGVPLSEALKTFLQSCRHSGKDSSTPARSCSRRIPSEGVVINYRFGNNAGMAAPAFRGVRRDIALALSGERRRTLYETAKAIGRRSGDIQRSFRQMHDEGLIEADSPPTRGTEYWLSEAAKAALMEEIAETTVPGTIAERQRLYVMTAPDPPTFYELLGQTDVAGVIAWAAELGGQGEWLVALDLKSSPAEAARLSTAVRAIGFSCQDLLVQSILGAAQLRQLSAATGAVLERP